MFGKDQSDWKEALKHAPPKALGKIREFIERSTHNARIQAMVELGRLAKEEKQTARSVLDEMRGGDFSERFLALHSCHGSRDGEQMLAAISDRSETIRAVARKLLCIYGTDDDIVRAFEMSPLAARKSFLRQLRVRKRFVSIDLILSKLAESDLQDFSAYLPYGSVEFIRDQWPELEEDSSAIEWERLTRNQPDFAAERILDLLERLSAFEPRTVWIANSVLALLAKQRAERTVEVIEVMLNVCSLNQIRLTEAVRSFPIEVAEICSESEDRANVNFYFAYDKLNDDLLVATMRKYPPSYGLAKILRKLPVSTRRVLYENLAPAWRADDQGILDDGIVEEMPRDIREYEAGTHLAMDSLFTNPQLRMKYVPFLPFDEVKEFVSGPLSDPDAELRGVAWAALIGALRFNRDEATYVLDELKKRKREQDPVRQVIAQALSMLPPSVFQEAHLGDISQIVRDALDSRDISHMTVFYFEMLILQLVPLHPHWCAESLALIWKERGRPAVQNFQLRINDEQAKKLEPEVVEVLKRWSKKEYESTVIATASLFGRRLKSLSRITAMLEDIVLNSHSDVISRQSFNVLKNNAFSSLNDLVPKMLKRDSSWGTDASVIQYLLKRRQDLLTPYLGQQAHRGRLNSGKNAIVPDLTVGLSRLSSDQMRIYAKSLNSMSSDAENRGWENSYVISHLSRIPNCPIEYLSRFINGSRARPYERDLALTVASRLDEGQGVPLLVEALQDPALAYVAIYSLRSCIMKMPGARAFEILNDAPMTQVTVAKEIVRLLGDIRYEPALEKLLASSQQELHRDIRIAIIGGLWRNLDRAESWEVLARSMNDEDPAVVYAVIRTPADRLNRDGQKRLLDLLLGGLKHDSIRVRMKTLERLGYFPVNDSDMVLLDALIESLSSESPEECRVAARAIVQLYGHKALNAFPRAAAAVISKRRNVLKFVEHLEAALSTSRSKLIPATYATITALEPDLLTLTLRARLAVASMPWSELSQWLKELDEKQLLHPDLVAEIGNRLCSSRRNDIDELSEFESELSASDSVSLRRIALYALMAQSGTSRGWTEERLHRLESFRNDSSAAIAEVAQFTLPAEEEALKAAQR